MAKMTLLEMTKNILSAMNSDDVNSISDTVESQQVAEEIRTTFIDLFSNRDIPELEGLINLEASGDVDRPNALRIPEEVERLKWITYLNYRTGNRPSFKYIEYLEPELFIKRIIEGSETDYGRYALVPLLSTSPLKYSIPANKSPDFYTFFDEEQLLVFDSYDADYESHLTGANSLAWGIKTRNFPMADDYVPPIDANLFPLFLAEARSACFINVKEVANSKEEQRARRQLVRSQSRTHKTNPQRRGAFDGTNYARNR